MSKQGGDEPGCLVVVGAGLHAKVVLAVARATGWSISGLLDDEPGKWGTFVLGQEVTGPVAALAADSMDCLVRHHLAIGSNEVREKLATDLSMARFATLIHPTAIVDPTARIGPGTLVGAAAVIQPDAHIGRHVIVNTGAVVEHDAIIGDFCHLGPQSTVCGNVQVGTGTFVGAAATIVPDLHLGAWSIVGAGAVVVRDVPDHVVVTGVPGRLASRRSEPAAR